jgi:hypothetical protein
MLEEEEEEEEECLNLSISTKGRCEASLGVCDLRQPEKVPHG